jgi:hypothetical protein
MGLALRSGLTGTPKLGNAPASNRLAILAT